MFGKAICAGARTSYEPGANCLAVAFRTLSKVHEAAPTNAHWKSTSGQVQVTTEGGYTMALPLSMNP